MYCYYVSLSNYSIYTKHYKKSIAKFSYSFDKYVLYIIFQNNKTYYGFDACNYRFLLHAYWRYIGSSVVPGAPMSWVASAPLFYNCDSSKPLDSQHIIGNHYHFNIRIYPVQRNKTIRRKFLWHLGNKYRTSCRSS
jgi:hypothetical protein